MAAVIYEWQAWDGFLLTTLYPAALKVSARIGESADDVLGRLPPDASLFCFHIDLTHSGAVPLGRPALVEGLRARGVSVLNGALTDISKRRVQSACRACGLPTTEATREGDPEERLIVKTDLNYGGHPERQLQPEERALLGLTSPGDAGLTSRKYYVTRRRDVTEEQWALPSLMIERFVSNRVGLFFRAHVLFDRMVLTAAIDRREIKETRWGIRRHDFCFEGLSEAPPLPQAYDLSREPGVEAVPWLVQALHRFCKDIGLDFGAIDVAVDDEARCHIIDANATPYWNRPDLEEIVRFLAAGRPIDAATP